VKDILNLIAVVLIAAWAVGFFVLSMGIFIHMFLVVALIALMLRLIQGRRIFGRNNSIIHKLI
jgi:hypothetical protein